MTSLMLFLKAMRDKLGIKTTHAVGKNLHISLQNLFGDHIYVSPEREKIVLFSTVVLSNFSAHCNLRNKTCMQMYVSLCGIVTPDN